MDITKEIIFRTARSGGKGGQNVNKVETMVEGYFSIAESAVLTSEQKAVLEEKLASKINSDGMLQVKSQTHRTQLGNKEEVIKKMHALLEKGLKQEKPRKKTRTPAAVKAKRLDSKKRQSQTKEGRKKIRGFE